MCEPRLCETCQSWRPSEDDAWCGNCGGPCAQIKIEVQPDVMQVGNLVPPLRFKLLNRSCADLIVQGFDLPSWVTSAEVPPVVPAYGTQQFRGTAKTIDMRSPQAGLVAVRTQAGKASTVLMAIEEAPKLQCHPAELELWGEGAKELQMTVVPKDGALRLRGARQGPAGTFEVVSKPAGPVLALPAVDEGMTLTLRMDVAQFRARPRGVLLVEFDGPHGPAEIEVPIQAVVRDPPQVRWTEEHKPPAELFAMAGEHIEFVLSNQASDRDGGTRNALLSIENVTLQASSDAGEVPVRLKSQLPQIVPGGHNLTVSFEVDLSKVQIQRPALIQFHLTVESNAPVLKRVRPVFVRPLQEYDGVLAIDFGSSNTCAAVVESGREYERLPLDGTEQVSPTVVRYISLSGPSAAVETGARVKELASKSEQVAASTIRGLKQRLGDEHQDVPVRPYDAAEWTTRTASQAAGDYLREMRHVLEVQKKTIFREFILTHPAVCSLRQYHNLHRALSEAFGGAEHSISYLQEPIAAIIPFLLEQSEKPNVSGYTVASFDLGGGTTDIALVRVENRQRAEGQIEVRPSILYCRGVRFGGENLTDFLEDELKKRIEQYIAKEKPGYALVQEGLPRASSEDVLRNSYALRGAAEQFKASLSEERLLAPSEVTVRLLGADKSSPEDDRVEFSRIKGSGTEGLKDVFLLYLRGHVQQMAQLLQFAEKEKGKINIIQISGKTAYLPDVKHAISEMFPHAKVVRARDPKECVVTGACLSRAMGRGAKRRLIMSNDMRRTTSSIGVFDTISRRFTAALPVDTPIPEEGLRGRISEAWFGSEKIVLWENLGATDEELRNAGTHMLSKLGTWRPARECRAAEADGWALELLLKNFEVALTAIGPAGESVPFIQIAGAS